MLFKKKKTVSFLVSGKGSNFKAVAEKILSGYIPAEAGIMISSSGDALALKKAEELGIRALAVEPKSFSSKEAHEAEMIKYFEMYKTDLIVAAGYMRILLPSFINMYRNRIINIHPSLLPSFTGKNAQQQALDYGVKVTGCTTHFVDEGADTGPIIMQAPVYVMENDDSGSLSTRILAEEHKILVESVKLFCENKLQVKENRVIIKN